MVAAFTSAMSIPRQPMPGPGASTAFTPTPFSPIIVFVVASEAPTASHDDDFLFGDLEGLQDNEHLDELPDYELVEEVVGEIQQIKGNSGVGSPEVRKYVDAWSPPVSPLDGKEAHLRVLAQNLYQRRPVLYLKGHSQPYPAQVLLRTVRKPSVGALSAAAGPAGLFKYPSNSFIVIKFDPQFGYADIIVDPFFTDAFIQQPATATYSKLLSELPRAFVGTAPELRRVVALLTQQSIRAYAAKGATCPPWRRFDAMLARWVPKKFTDEVITHGPGATVNPTVNSVAAPQLVRFDSTSSSASNNGVFSLGSSSKVGSFSSSAATSAPRTVVHGFEIPSKVAITAAVETGAEPAAALLAAATDEAVTATADVAASVDAAAVPVLEQQYDSLGDVIAAKLATVDDSADAAGSSWQLATELAVDESHDGDYSSSISSDTSAYAASYTVKDTRLSCRSGARVIRNTRAPAVVAKAPLAMLQLQLLHQRGVTTPPAAAAIRKDPSDQLLAAAGYSTRSVKLLGPTPVSAAAAATGRAQAATGTYSACTPISGVRYERICCECSGKENAACVDVDAHSSSVTLSTAAVDRVLEGPHDKGLADALAKIRESVMRCPAVPASGPSPKVVGGRKVVRLDYAGAVVCRAV